MSISADNQRLLENLVQTGPFKNEDEAISEALRLLRDQSQNGNATDKNGDLLPPDEQNPQSAEAPFESQNHAAGLRPR